MELFIRILSRLGFNGASLDKAINIMIKADALLEKVEKTELEKAVKAQHDIQNAIKRQVEAEETAARASRIRARAQEFIA